jgi:hypothetical protein
LWKRTEDLGSKVALAVARNLVLFLKRPGGQAQFSRSLAAKSSTRKSMQELFVWIVENLGKKLNRDFSSARGGLEPGFTVLFSVIFHGVSLEISIRVENYGIERKQNCSQL